MAIRNLSPTPVLTGLPQILLASHLPQRLFYLPLVSSKKEKQTTEFTSVTYI